MADHYGTKAVTSLIDQNYYENRQKWLFDRDRKGFKFRDYSEYPFHFDSVGKQRILKSGNVE